VLWAVNANWNSDGLNVEANPLDNPNDWNVGNRFLSRNSLLSRPLVVRVFRKDALLPPTCHAPHLFNIFPEQDKMRISHEFCFPGNLEKESHSICAPKRFVERCYFLLRPGVCRDTESIQQVKPQAVETITDAESFGARHLPMSDNPDQIPLFGSLNDGEQLRGG